MLQSVIIAGLVERQRPGRHFLLKFFEKTVRQLRNLDIRIGAAFFDCDTRSHRLS